MDKKSVVAALEAYGLKVDTKQNLARLKKLLEKTKISAEVRRMSSEQLFVACGKYGIDTRRTVDRKALSLIQLYRYIV
jgi:hemin uptake protein HemP